MLRGGAYIIDGTVRFIVDDTRDGHNIGEVIPMLYVPNGYVRADGKEVNRADYPRLIKLADTYNLWTDDVNTYKGLFGKGNGSTTFVLPNYENTYAHFTSSDTIGKFYGDQLPNIKGALNEDMWVRSLSQPSGAFYTPRHNETGGSNNGNFVNSPTGVYGGTYFDASRSNNTYKDGADVQPKHIELIPCIKY